MSDTDEFRCFIGGLAWSTSDRRLKDAFEKYGKLVEAKVVVDKFSGRSRGFGFVTFDDKEAMEEAIEAMNGIDLDGRTITVDKAQPQGSRDDDDRHRERGRDSRDRNRSRDYGGSRGSNGGDCFKCGKPGHFARECPSEGERGGRYGGRESRYSGGYGPDRNADRSYGGRDRDSGGRDRDGGGRDRDGGGRDRDGGGRDRDGGGRDRDGGGRDRDGGGRDRDRDRAGPYERRGSGGHR